MKEELIKHFKKRYPIGTKIISDYAKEQGVPPEYIITSYETFYDNYYLRGESNGKTPFVYYKDKWAQIIFKPNKIKEVW